MEGPDFWKSDQRFDILGQLECIDRIEAATRRAGSLLNRIGGGRKPRRGTFPPDMVKTIAQTVHLVETAREDLAERRPREAFIQVDAGRDGDAFAARLADMYVAWARNRRMHYQVLDNRRAPAAKGFVFRMAVSGFGAHTLLADEAGLHVLETGAEGDTKAPRSTARVSVAAQPLEPGGNGTEALRQRARAVFEDGAPPSRKIVRRYREEPSPLVRDAVRGWRTGRADRVFAGDFDLFE
jgi:ATP-dependent Clp protease ATP-binding subunit ClpC